MTKALNKAQHSPLPWSVAIYPAIKRAPDQDVQEYVEITACGWPIAHVYGTPKAIDNARLIVACVNQAAQLAEALRAASNDINTVRRVLFENHGITDDCDDTFEATLRIINKALAAYEAAQ